jgi:serine/threonine protein phosphatase PrpC
VPGDLIQTTLSSSYDSEQAADRLVALAVDHGAPDNITVIVIDAKEE